LVIASSGDNTIVVLINFGTGQFFQGGSFPTGNVPSAIAVGDFNGDLKTDVVTANISDNTVSVLLGNGDGTFQAATSYPAGTNPDSVTVADFNGDGKADLAVADEGGGISVLLGNGDGTFQAATTYAAGAGPWSVISGDFNIDGKQDLAVANYFDNDVSILIGNGDGTFQMPVNYPVGTTPYSVTVGDFNSDSKQDLAVANNDSDDVSVLLGNGDGTFQTAVNYGVGFNPQFVATSDFNGDGRLDLATVNYESKTASLLFNSQGVFITFHAAPNPSSFSQPVTFTMTATASLRGVGTPTGTATFTELLTGNILASNVPLTSGVAQFTTAALAVGPDIVLANYSGDNNFAAAAGQIIQTVQQATSSVTLTSSANPSNPGQSVTFTAMVGPSNVTVPTGNVQFFDGATQLSNTALNAKGVASLTTSTLSVGNHTITAKYSGDPNFAPNMSPALVQTVTSPSFTIFATALNPATVAAGQSATAEVSIGSLGGFAASVALGCSGLPTGAACSFNPASVTATPNGTVTSVLTVTLGSNTPAGSYDFAVSGSSSGTTHSTILILTAVISDFTLAGTTPSPTSVSPGQSSTATITVTSKNGFNAAVELTCSVSPSPALGPICSLAPSSVTPPSGASVTSKLTFSTTAPSSALLAPPGQHWRKSFYALLLPFAGIVCMGPWVNRKNYRTVTAWLLLTALLCLLSLVGCGGGSGGCSGATCNPGSPGTPSGAYVVTVTAKSGTTQHTTTVQMTVQ
jgi:hypothetical protein